MLKYYKLDSFIYKLTTHLTGFNLTCAICGDELFNNRYHNLCEYCYNQLTLNEGKECKLCGSIIPSTSPSEYCSYCANEKVYYDALRAAVVMDGFSRRFVLEVKANHCLDYAKIMAEFMYEKFLKLDFNVDIATPVPKFITGKTHFNHSEKIAIEFCRLSNLPLSDALIKSVKTEGQESKSREQRAKNVSQSFSITDKNDFMNKNVLIIDDVRTTGATMNECAKTLKLKAQAKLVYGISFSGTKTVIPTE
ncbi:MAG: phosphoribosyltransferase family protein [Clostridia bacterium]